MPISKARYNKVKNNWKYWYLSWIINKKLGEDFSFIPNPKGSKEQITEIEFTFDKYSNISKVIKELGLREDQIDQKGRKFSFILTPRQINTLGNKIGKKNPDIIDKMFEGFGEENIRSEKQYLKENRMILKNIQNLNKQLEKNKITKKDFEDEYKTHEDYATNLLVHKQLLDKYLPEWKMKERRFEPVKNTYHSFIRNKK